MSRWVPGSVAVAGVVLAAAGHLHLQAARLPGAVQPALAPRPSHTQTTVTSAAAVGVPSRALLDQYCITCHNEKLKTAGLMLDKADIQQVAAGADVWEKVIRKLRAGAMPPAGRPRPDAATSRAFVSWLETELDRAAMAKPNPGRPAVHRLNRIEYSNAIRDLFGLDVDANALLPADDEQHGFDNIADILSVSPTLIERYMVAAQRISQLAVGDSSLRPTGHTYLVNGWLDQDERTSDDLPFGSRGGCRDRHLPRRRRAASSAPPSQASNMDMFADSASRINWTCAWMAAHRHADGCGRVWGEHSGRRWGLQGSSDRRNSESSGMEAYSLHADEGLEVRASVKGGPHLIGISFDRRPALPEGSAADRQIDDLVWKDELQNSNPAVSSRRYRAPTDE